MANVMDHLRPGRENAVHLSELSELLGIRPETVKSNIRKARAQGEQILSGSCGYWLAESPDEMQRYVNMMRRQALSRLVTIKPIRNTLEQVNGQINLSDALSEALEVGTNGKA